MPVLQKTKEAYKLWHQYHGILPKTHRYSLGNKVDGLLIDLIESLAIAAFLSSVEKLPYIRIAIQKLDTTKILLLILWESHSLPDTKYITLSQELDAIGRMLGGWSGQLIKQNSLAEAREK